jgi:hypothetical protein
VISFSIYYYFEQLISVYVWELILMELCINIGWLLCWRKLFVIVFRDVYRHELLLDLMMLFKWFLVLLTNLLDGILVCFGGGVAVQTINRLVSGCSWCVIWLLQMMVLKCNSKRVKAERGSGSVFKVMWLRGHFGSLARLTRPTLLNGCIKWLWLNQLVNIQLSVYVLWLV